MNSDAYMKGDTMINNYVLGLLCCMVLMSALMVPAASTELLENQVNGEYAIATSHQTDIDEPSGKDGWMLQWSYAYGGLGHAEFAQPFGDLDGDGVNEIILGGYENSGICRIYSYDFALETYVEEYSWFVPGSSYHTPSGACVVDLDEDGDLEFCVSWGYSDADGVYAYSWDGDTLTTLDYYAGTGVDFIYDIYACDYDDDTHPEVMIANDPNPGGIHVSALGWNVQTSSFTYETSWTCPDGSGYSVPMVWSGDVDLDGRTEVIADVSELNYDTAGTWALNWNDATEEWIGEPVYTSYPAGVTVFGDGVGDVDGDGTPEIGVGSYGGTPGGWLFEWDGSDYVLVWHGEYPGQEPVIESVAIGDADNDGDVEFCFGTGNVHVIGWDGADYYEEATLTGPTNMLAGLNIGDCDTDGKNEIKGCEILGGTGTEFIWKYIVTDVTPPETTCTLDGELSGEVYVSNVTVMLTATDDYSGVDSTMYLLDDGAWTTYTDPLTVSDDGLHTVRFYSVDTVGNVEPENSTSFTIQKETQSISIAISGGVGVKAIITNTGTTELTNLSWTIHLDGVFVLFGKTTSGLIPALAPGGSATVKDFVFGVGKTRIAVDVGSSSANATGTVFLFFVFGIH
jgi:hypothetical protein